MNIPGVEGSNNDKSYREIMERSFRVLDDSSVKNKDLNYRPAPVLSDYDVIDERTGTTYNSTSGSWDTFNRDDIRPPGTEDCSQEDDIFQVQTGRKRSYESLDTRKETLSGEGNVLPFPLPKRSKEEPPIKIDYSSRFKFSCPDLTDHTLPNELKLQFQPLFCKLCSMTLTSNTMARVHYISKNHNKKVKKWLVEYSERTGEPLHPRAVSNDKKDQMENPSYYFCNVCNIPLTGKLHSESHYMGRQHHKAVRECRNTGNVAPTTNYPKEILDNKKTLPFLNEGCSSGNGNGNNVPEDSKGNSLFCELCSVMATCKEQLEQHLQGSKHKKKLNHVGGVNVNSPKGNADFAEYRTPSGFFYCNICKVTVNSAAQFKSHQESKKHRTKAGSSNAV